jgi:dolichol kinase
MSGILLKEIIRKFIHLSGIFIPLIYFFIGRYSTVFWLSLIVMTMFIMEWMRLNGYIKYPEFLLRPFEEHTVAGYIYSTTAALIVIALFPMNVAIAALTMAVIGDTSSGIAGSVFGNKANIRQMGHRVKPVPILMIMFLTSLISGYLVIDILMPDQIALIALVAGALGASIADGVPWQIRGRVLDDNLTIPFTCAVVILMFS